MGEIRNRAVENYRSKLLRSAPCERSLKEQSAEQVFLKRFGLAFTAARDDASPAAAVDWPQQRAESQEQKRRQAEVVDRKRQAEEKAHRVEAEKKQVEAEHRREEEKARAAEAEAEQNRVEAERRVEAEKKRLEAERRREEEKTRWAAAAKSKEKRAEAEAERKEKQDRIEAGEQQRSKEEQKVRKPAGSTGRARRRRGREEEQGKEKEITSRRQDRAFSTPARVFMSVCFALCWVMAAVWALLTAHHYVFQEVKGHGEIDVATTGTNLLPPYTPHRTSARMIRPEIQKRPGGGEGGGGGGGLLAINKAQAGDRVASARMMRLEIENRRRDRVAVGAPQEPPSTTISKLELLKYAKDFQGKVVRPSESSIEA